MSSARGASRGGRGGAKAPPPGRSDGTVARKSSTDQQTYESFVAQFEQQGKASGAEWGHQRPSNPVDSVALRAKATAARQRSQQQHQDASSRISHIWKQSAPTQARRVSGDSDSDSVNSSQSHPRSRNTVKEMAEKWRRKSLQRKTSDGSGDGQGSARGSGGSSGQPPVSKWEEWVRRSIERKREDGDSRSRDSSPDRVVHRAPEAVSARGPPPLSSSLLDVPRSARSSRSPSTHEAPAGDDDGAHVPVRRSQSIPLASASQPQTPKSARRASREERDESWLTGPESNDEASDADEKQSKSNTRRSDGAGRPAADKPEVAKPEDVARLRGRLKRSKSMSALSQRMSEIESALGVSGGGADGAGGGAGGDAKKAVPTALAVETNGRSSPTSPSPSPGKIAAIARKEELVRERGEFWGLQLQQSTPGSTLNAETAEQLNKFLREYHASQGGAKGELCALDACDGCACPARSL